MECDLIVVDKHVYLLRPLKDLETPFDGQLIGTSTKFSSATSLTDALEFNLLRVPFSRYLLHASMSQGTVMNERNVRAGISLTNTT